MKDEEIRQILMRYAAPDPAEDLEARLRIVLAKGRVPKEPQVNAFFPWDLRLAGLAVVLSLILAIGLGFVRARPTPRSLDDSSFAASEWDSL